MVAPPVNRIVSSIVPETPGSYSKERMLITPKP